MLLGVLVGPGLQLLAHRRTVFTGALRIKPDRGLVGGRRTHLQDFDPSTLITGFDNRVTILRMKRSTVLHVLEWKWQIENVLQMPIKRFDLRSEKLDRVTGLRLRSLMQLLLPVDPREFDCGQGRDPDCFMRERL